MSVVSLAGSDISEFAAWEKAHPLIDGEVHEQSREQSIIDMARPERVWEGADSSNDARSEDEEELLQSQISKKSKKEKRSAKKNLNGTEKVIPSSTQTSLPTESQKSDAGLAVQRGKGFSQDLQGRKLVSLKSSIGREEN